MPGSRQDWGDAYAQQSASDFRIYEILIALDCIPVCHSLHYLQMACEKIAKAYQFRDQTTSETRLTTSHVAFSKFMDSFISSPKMRQEYKGRDAQLIRVRQSTRNLAREIEKLAPAVDREHSPSNAEYPWESNEGVVLPCVYTYPNLSSLREPTGLHFLKLIKEAITSFDKLTIK
jgi:hypothetical protein